MAKLTSAQIDEILAASTTSGKKSKSGNGADTSTPEGRANLRRQNMAQAWLNASGGKAWKRVQMNLETGAELHTLTGLRTQEYVLLTSASGERFIAGPGEYREYAQYPGSYVPYSGKGEVRKARVNLDGTPFVPTATVKEIPESTVSTETGILSAGKPVAPETKKLLSVAESAAEARKLAATNK